MVTFPPSLDLHGAYLRADLAAALGSAALRTALRDGRLATFSRTVLVDPRRAADFGTRAAAALLHAGPDAMLSQHSALRVHGFCAADTNPIHVLVPYRCKPRRRAGVLVHHGSVREEDIHEIAGLRVVDVDLALSEVLCRGSRRDALACADEALRALSPHDRETFRLRVEERIAARPDPRGRRQGRSLLWLATGLAESPAESAMLLTLVEAELPVPEQQVPVTDIAGRVLYRLDFAWSQVRVAVEYDGYEAHEASREADAERDEDLRRRGWIVLRADAADLRDPSRLVAAVLDAFRRRGLTA
ncbi:hypothetical protein FHU38_004396 [Saccharomonospora amisosensis]|uniref:DUF559 domain-containing protein n=1 Tax=Saccharomonospora amisosensis TaxID=1128677 RepID=A0A7X5ZSM2_9PSEU|nr:DUF559 domain-containing protein [Saccharomonospora amisosensis]NIJ14052.1 hypothetical protein [Saccharomonospora amisosensis]